MPQSCLSGVQPPFPYSLTFTNLYELSFSETKPTHQSRERERERDGNDEFEQRNGVGDDAVSASVFDAIQSWELGRMGYSG